MNRSILRIVVKSLGWVMISVGIFLIFNKQGNLFHYSISLIGIIMIVVYFPYIDFLKKKTNKQRGKLMNTEKTIKLIALDMDGTLLTSTDEVSENTRLAIKQAKDKGVAVMISTGRWLDRCSAYVDMLELNTPIITVNGGEIWSSEKELIERHIHDAKVMEKMFEIGKEIGVVMWIVSTERVYNVGDYPTDFDAHDWLKIGFKSDNLSKLDIIRKKLSHYDGLELTNSLPTNIEVNPLGVNKANAVLRVCEELGISIDEVMAIGDSLNDIKMIEQAGIGVAMGNAQDKVKKTADYTTTSNDEDGVAKAIQKFILK